MTNDQEDILDKVAKLMAKAKGTSNEHEAAIFAAKAAEMLAKHNLDEAMLRDRDASREEGPIGAWDYEGRVPDQWRALIVQGCAKLYFCKVLIHTNVFNKKKTYRLYGREHNAVVANMMAEYLIATVKRMAREHTDLRINQQDFRRGAGIRLYERLVELYELQNKPAPVSANPHNLPALYAGEENAVQAYIDEKFGNVKAKKSRAMQIGASGRAGMDAANRINLNTQVAEKRSSRMIGRS